MSKLPRDWITAALRLLQRETVVVRIVVAEARGSVPREPGAFMLAAGDGVLEGTIGGGRLEWEAVAAARELLGDVTAPGARLNRVVLGADLGQCCGGVVSVWLERFTRDDVGFLRAARDAGVRGSAVLSSTAKATSALVGRCVVSAPGEDRAADELLGAARLQARPLVVHGGAGEVTFVERLDDPFPAVWLYGAGHVGQALARILTDLPLRLTWIDSRAELFPAGVAEGVRIRCEPDAAATVSDAPAGAHFLVMTHSHPLDYALCQAILKRGDFGWLGLIGSESKAARFRSRLRRDGVGMSDIARLVCPIGIQGIHSKWPAAIAVAVAAQVMQRISAAAAEPAGTEWRDGAAEVPRPPRGEQREERVGPSRLLPGEQREVAIGPQRPLRAGQSEAVESRSHWDAGCATENCATCGTTAGATESTTLVRDS